MPKAFRGRRGQKEIPIPDNVEIVIDTPPIYETLCAWLGARPKGVVFTYADKIYNPEGFDIPGEIIEHEVIHMHQQNFSEDEAALWWGKWLRDDDFRIDQEAGAYARQYNVVCRYRKDKNYQSRYLLNLAHTLSGPLYGRSITTPDAIKLLKEYAHV